MLRVTGMSLCFDLKGFVKILFVASHHLCDGWSKDFGVLYRHYAAVFSIAASFHIHALKFRLRAPREQSLDHTVGEVTPGIASVVRPDADKGQVKKTKQNTKQVGITSSLQLTF